LGFGRDAASSTGETLHVSRPEEQEAKARYWAIGSLKKKKKKKKKKTRKGKVMGEERGTLLCGVVGKCWTAVMWCPGWEVLDSCHVVSRFRPLVLLIRKNEKGKR
jgi:hypothetical protein